MAVRRRDLPRLLMLLLIVALVGAGLFLLFGTRAGAEFRSHPHEFLSQFHGRARTWTAAHRVLAPLAVLALYVLVTVAMMPMWWIPVLAGVAMGYWWGLLWSEVGGTAAAVVTFVLARWLAADFFHGKIESKLARLRALDERLSHNGLLVVMVARLIHVLPFGPSYYLFGMTTMTTPDVAVGTLLGYLPVCMFLVKTGAGWDHHHPLRFVLTLIIVQGVLLVPIVLRYMAPQWFKKVGIE